MIKIDNKDREYLKKSNIDIDEALKAEDFWKVLDIINEAIIFNILDNDDEPDSHGIYLQKIYDRIYMQNKDGFQ